MPLNPRNPLFDVATQRRAQSADQKKFMDHLANTFKGALAGHYAGTSTGQLMGQAMGADTESLAWELGQMGIPDPRDLIAVMGPKFAMAFAAKLGLRKELYHASKQNIVDAFIPGYDDGLIFLTPDPKFANRWLGLGKYRHRLDAEEELDLVRDQQRALHDKINREYGVYEHLKDKDRTEFSRLWKLADQEFKRREPIGPDKVHNTVYPVRANIRKIFHPEEDMADLDDFFRLYPGEVELLEYYKNGNYLVYENKRMVKYLKSKGYDSMYLKESQMTDEPYTTVAVFDPKNVRSAFAKPQ